MAKLHSLIKFKRHELDEKRRLLADLNLQLEALQQRRQKLLDDLAHEKNLAAVDIEIARNFGFYVTRVLNEQQLIDEQISDKLQQVQAATVVVQEAYLDTKKVEIAQEKRDEAEQDRLDKIDDDAMNEIGIENFRRKSDADNK